MVLQHVFYSASMCFDRIINRRTGSGPTHSIASFSSTLLCGVINPQILNYVGKIFVVWRSYGYVGIVAPQFQITGYCSTLLFNKHPSAAYRAFLRYSPGSISLSCRNTRTHRGATITLTKQYAGSSPREPQPSKGVCFHGCGGSLIFPHKAGVVFVI